MKNKSKEYKISQELRKIAYMLCMVAVIFLADIAVVNATSEDDGAAAEPTISGSHMTVGTESSTEHCGSC